MAHKGGGVSGDLSVIYWYHGTWHTRVGLWTWRGGEGGERRAQSSGRTNGDTVHIVDLYRSISRVCVW